MTPLGTIKTVHTAIWAFMVALIAYICYSGITNSVTTWTWFAVALVSAESIVVMANGWTCPLTTLASRHTEPDSPNFDIYLPMWLARYNLPIFGSLFGLGLMIVVWRVLSPGG